MMNVFVFKTSVKEQDLIRLNPILNHLLSGKKWNFDLTDCDRILRIESQKDISTSVCACLNELGFVCLELT
jgi:hypothetical protein